MAAVRAERAPRRAFLSFERRVPFAIAASFAIVACAVALLFSFAAPSPAGRLAAIQNADGTFSSGSLSAHVQAFAVKVLAADSSVSRAALDSAVAVLVRGQNAQGGWDGAELSVRNTAALAAAVEAGDACARPAYLRARRYLKLCGLPEIRPAGLVAEAKRVLARYPSADCAPLPVSACAM